MTNELKFLDKFFTAKTFELNTVRISLRERASYDIDTEDYGFRVEISEVIDEIHVSTRDLAIEDHHSQQKHQKPHLQFKLHADGIGHIHIFLPITNEKEYKKYILGFLDIIGGVLIKIDNEDKELQNNFMIAKNFEKIKGRSNLIKQVVAESYANGKLQILTTDRVERFINKEDIAKIKQIPQILPFFERI